MTALVGSRPLRAVAGVLASYVVARSLFVWWPAAQVDTVAMPVPVAIPMPMPVLAARSPTPARLVAARVDQAQLPPEQTSRALPLRRRSERMSQPAALPPIGVDAREIAAAAMARPLEPEPPPRATAAAAVRGMPDASDTHWRRSSLSAWLVVRPDGARSLSTNGQLGGSQAGVRGYVPLGRTVSLTASLAAPLRMSGAEGSVGLAYRRGTVGVLAERRFRVSGTGRDAFAMTAFGGIDDVRIARAVRLDGYAQAGLVGRDAFVDGAATAERVLGTGRWGSVGVAAGAWGAAQPALRRLDVGPALVARLPVTRATARVSLDWRVRIAGNARPATGPALTLASDF